MGATHSVQALVLCVSGELLGDDPGPQQPTEHYTADSSYPSAPRITRLRSASAEGLTSGGGDGGLFIGMELASGDAFVQKSPAEWAGEPGAPVTDMFGGLSTAPPHRYQGACVTTTLTCHQNSVACCVGVAKDWRDGWVLSLTRAYTCCSPRDTSSVVLAINHFSAAPGNPGIAV